MAANKTQPTDASVADYLVSRANAQQLADCEELMAILHRVTREPPTMWGPSIVGYGRYHYTYESGRTGQMPVVGFAIRGREIVLYVTTENDAQQALLARLGPHRMGKSCLYVKRLADLDVGVLEQIVAGSVAEVRQRYG